MSPAALRQEKTVKAAAVQRRAAAPEASVWVAASAGTGKTKVLTDRVLSLMLHGNDPARILCLTFTKAAAAEMANRLAQRLASWAALADTVEGSAGECLESVSYQETYRDPKKDGTGKKRLLFSITLRSSQRTLTNEEADRIRQQVVEACDRKHGAVLLGG